MFGMDRRRPDWATDGRDWPNREASRFVRAGAVHWHVQIAGPEDAPVLLLLHGTGAATHSFRDLLPLLAEDFRVVAPDLPGHGFTDARSDAALSLPGMASAVAALCEALEVVPVYGAGHSAGAAILLRMALSGQAPFEGIVGINAALTPIEGNAILSPLAKLLFVNPLVPWLFARRAASGDTVRSLLARTGSMLDADGLRFYETLARNPAHVAGALGMMANWDLHGLQADLGASTVPTTFIVAQDDPMVPPTDSGKAATRIDGAEIAEFGAGGHLLHEVEPEAVAREIGERFSRKAKQPS